MRKTIWQYPNSIERKLIRIITIEIASLVKEYYKRLHNIRKYKRDDDLVDPEYTEEDSNSVEIELSALLAWWLNRMSAIRTTITFLFGDLNKFNDKQFIIIMQILTGVTLPVSQTVSPDTNDLVSNYLQAFKVLGDKVDLSRAEPFIAPSKSNFIANTTNIIDGIGSKLVSDLNAITRTGLQQNLSEKELREIISNKLTTLDKTIKILSREVITKINSELSKNRQISMGFSRYVWNTQLDERVRPAHVALEATIHSWDNAPSEGHPGSAYMCRCWATPIR